MNTTCPACKHVLRDDRPPVEGAFGVCPHCTAGLRMVRSPFQPGVLVVSQLRLGDEQAFEESGAKAAQDKMRRIMAEAILADAITPRCPLCHSEPLVAWCLPYFCANERPFNDGGCRVLSWDPLQGPEQITRVTFVDLLI